MESRSGLDRAMLYIVAAWTGFRKGEIGSLTLCSLHLDDDPPTATVEACDTCSFPVGFGIEDGRATGQPRGQRCGGKWDQVLSLATAVFHALRP